MSRSRVTRRQDDPVCIELQLCHLTGRPETVFRLLSFSRWRQNKCRFGDTLKFPRNCPSPLKLGHYC